MTKIGKAARTRQAASIAADLMLAPLVMAMRLPLMARETSAGQPGSTETTRAVNEKTAALANGMLAAQMSFLQSAARFWPEVLSGRTPSLLNGVAAQRSIKTALKPASRTVRANFHRLSNKA